MRVQIKRVYNTPSPYDGQRILVDRLWPRGLSKPEAAVDAWLKDIAPSPALRKWFGHDPEKWDEFQFLYTDELIANTAAVADLRNLLQKSPSTLLYAAKDETHNHALVLRAYLESPN